MHLVKKISKKELIENKLSHLDLYSYYMPTKFELNQNCSNPFTSSDNIPSFRIYYKDGEYFHKAFNSSHKGDIWQFLMDLSGRDFNEVLDGVIQDFGLAEISGKKFEKVVQDLPKIEKKEAKITKIIAQTFNKWQPRHIDYLAQYSLIPEDLNFCNDTKCFPLKEFYINTSKMIVRSKEVGFTYNVGKYRKIYLPNRPKGEKFWSSIPFSHIHGLDNLKGCDVGILSKSIKDAAVISKYITKCVCVIQAENASAISKENLQILKNSCKKLYVAMDNDPPGKAASYQLCELLEAKHINPIDSILKLGGSDFADWVRLEGTEAVIQHFKNKGVI